MSKLAILLLCLATFLTGCTTVEPVRTKVVQIPASEWLMRKYVPIPEAPTRTGTSIVVNTRHQRAWLFKDGEVYSISATCTGRAGKRTPTGTFRVISKHRYHTSTIYNVPMNYFLRLNCMGGKVGLHSGQIFLEPASAGCIRLPNEKAIEFFENTPVGAIVVIADSY